MQLTEIVQLVLISFTVFIIVIFFVSYISYKTTKKNKNIALSDSNIQPEENTNEIQSSDLKSNNLDSTINPKTTPPKFQVFNPIKSSEPQVAVSITKKHFPRTLSIKL